MKLNNTLNDVNYRAKVVRLETINDHPNADRLKVALVDFQNIVVGIDTKIGDDYIFIPAEASINKEILAFNNQFTSSCRLNVSQRYVTLNCNMPDGMGFNIEFVEQEYGITPEEFINFNGKKCIQVYGDGNRCINDGEYTIGGEFGFFEKHGRVKAMKLRGVISEGYLMPISFVNDWLESKGEKFRITGDHVGEVFDSIGDVVFCRKYVNPNTLYKSVSVFDDQSVDKFITKFKITIGEFNRVNETSFSLKDKLKKGDKYLVNKNCVKSHGKQARKESRLVEDQFRLHGNTVNLKRNMHNMNPDDIITISEKLHGCNVTIGRPLVKKKIGILSRILKKLGFDIIDKKYDLVYASRRVVKNEYADQETQDFYDTDVWGYHANDISGKVLDGYTIYGEIVGHTPTGSSIQGKYDYGCKETESKLFVFRVTYTTPQGMVIELTHPQVQRYCEMYGLDMPETHYHGYLKDYKKCFGVDGMYEDVETWRADVLKELQNDFNEMDCPNCVNKVPREGVILRKEGVEFEAYKLKSNRFLEGETKSADMGETNIEDEG